MFKNITLKAIIEWLILPAFGGLYALGFVINDNVADNNTSISVLEERVGNLVETSHDSFSRAERERGSLESNQVKIQKQVASFSNREHRIYQEHKTLMETELHGLVVYTNNKRFGGTMDYIHLISFTTGTMWSYVAETEGNPPYVFSDEVKNLILLRDGSSKSFDDAMDAYLDVFGDVPKIHQAVEPSLSYIFKFNNIETFKEQLDGIYVNLKPDYKPSIEKVSFDEQSYVWQAACIKVNGIVEKEFQKRKLVPKKKGPVRL